MTKLTLVEPTIDYKEQAINYIEEFNIYFSEINGCGGLDRYVNDYEDWLNKLEEDKVRIADENRVPSITYFLVREEDNKIVGMINIRLELNAKLRELGGNIGYSIRPTERRQGYNKINLYLALVKCYERGIKEVLLDCDKDNLGSKKTIEALGGILKRAFYSDEYNCNVLSYVIDVEDSVKKYKKICE